MIEDNLLQLIETAKKKIQRDQKGTWSKGSQTYFLAMFDELEEVHEELKSSRRCYLEDELGDLLWVMMCLLQNLEAESKIEVEKVFLRANNKYAERLNAINSGQNWADIKEIQKQRLFCEQKKYN